MSRLRELRLHGFKSFADPTRFVFEPGVNAILGPNGSGKSNMADAVRWVLGEQSNRSLRTRRADDVIFAGSEQRKPQGMAEAILTLDNADGWLPIEFAEVSIGRRAYRSGEGEYLINGARARLRDVVDLLGEGRLGANELVVVGQGTVDAALSLRPDERRALFEEAAGVKALQVKRNEASGRLARALDNLTRVGDLVAELKPQVRRLALQAEHQQQHDALGARARALVVASHRRREKVARELLGEARRTAAAAESALVDHRASEQARREAIAAAEARYWEAEEASRVAVRAGGATREEVIRAEARLEAIDARLSELLRQLDRETEELADAERSLVAAVPEPADAEMLATLEAASAAEEAWRESLAELAAADQRLLEAEEAVASVRGRESDRIAAGARLSEEEARRRARREQAVSERQRLETQLEQARSAAGNVADRLRDASAQAARESQELEAAEASRDRAQQEADATRQRIVELTERLRAVRAEAEAIAGPSDAASRLSRRLAAAGWPTLLDSVQAPEAAWAAIEAVVGGELEAALLWSDGDPTHEISDARGAARILARGGASDARGRADALAAVGAERTLDEWLGVADAPSAFCRTVVAPSLRAVLDGWRRLPLGWSAVTTDGDLADARGVMALRGRGDPPGGAAARSHARRAELTRTLGSLELETAAAQHAAHEAAERLRLARDAHLEAGEAAESAGRLVRRARDEEEAEQLETRRLMERLAAMEGELESLEGESLEAPEPPAAMVELASLQAAAADARATRDAVASRRDAARERWVQARAAADSAEKRTASGLGDGAAREARIAHLRGSLPSLRASLGELEAERAALAEALEAARTADSAARAPIEEAERVRAACRAELIGLEGAQDDAGGRLAELERAAQAAAIEATRRDEALAALERERELALEGLPAGEPSGVDTSHPGSGDVETLDDAALESELRRVRRTLAQVGSVNPFAVEEHREMAGRLEEMTTQERDLRAAIGSAEELISRLDSEIAQRFDAAFRAIGERFDEYCRLLFAGGSGALSMGEQEDGEAPGGIEIVVRPPGKRLQRLGMLSGGERALTGVALLFAMLTVNPVPFCILDEVDAALDEANIGRFALALRKLSESIDFVVITHNRATIEIADTIYGVTMTDAAVSRVLSLRLADLPAEIVA